MLVDAWLARAAAAQPRRVAVGQLTYSALLAAARLGAGQLAAHGVRAGERVAITLPPGEPFVVALHAVLLLGAVAIPIDPRLAPSEAARQADGAAVVVDAELAGPVDARTPIRATHDLDAAAIVVHTSGTSSSARAVELTYGNWLWSALGSAAALGRDPDERWLCCLPLSHVGGLSILMRSVIGATTAVVHERFDTDRVLAALRDPAGPTMVSLVPTTLSRLLDAGLQRPPALRWALLGGAAIGEKLLVRARGAGVPVASTYGMTEACSQVLTHGRPLFCTRVGLADDSEILVSGPTVAPGSGPTLRTGDRGEIGADGRVVVLGRADDMIISGGENVAPAEVEAMLEAHSAVAEAAVFGRADPEWGQRVVAVVVLRDAVAVDPDALRAWCAERLARHQTPKTVELRADPLPRTPSGKLLRRDLT